MTIYRQFRVTYRKRLLVYSLLCVALATGNALFWLHKWHEQGVELCFADTMMTGVQPSFLLMLLIPPTLGLVHQLKFILEQPFVICALDNRARLARNLLAALLFIAFRAVMAVSIPSIALGALLFRGGKPCTWESGASYYAYMTGQTFGWRLAPDGQRGFYQCPAACSCGGQCAPVYRQIPTPDWCRPPTLPAKSPHFLYRSSRSYPLCDFSNRLSHPGYAVHSRPDRMPCGTLRPTVHFLSTAGASA